LDIRFPLEYNSSQDHIDFFHVQQIFHNPLE
jgi:hypothetical protein